MVASLTEKRVRFAAEVLPHLDAAYRFAHWLSRSPSDVDDIVQDAILRAFRGFDALRGAAAKPWLLTIVRNCCFTTLAQQRRRAHVPLPDEYDTEDGHAMIASTPDPETEAIDRDGQRGLERVLSTLAAEHREVLLLREIEDMDYRQIAAIIGVPLGTVMSRLARARAALRAAWPVTADGETRGVR